MKKVIGLVLFVICLAVTQPAQATLLELDSGWQYFEFGDVGSSWTDVYEFTLTTSAQLIVTDAYLSGDQFEVSNKGTVIGVTSVPTSYNVTIGSDYDTAAVDSQWSSGSWLLSAGDYEISGKAILSPFGNGGAAIRLNTVPEPTTMVLFGSGLVGFFMRRRKA